MIFSSKIEGLLSAIAIGVASGAVTSILAPTDTRMPRICFQIGDIGIDAPQGAIGRAQAPSRRPDASTIQPTDLPTARPVVLVPPPPSIDIIRTTSPNPLANLCPMPTHSPSTAISDITELTSNLLAQTSGSPPANPSDAGAETPHTSGGGGGGGGSTTGVRGARPVASIFPAYPETSRERGEQGTVELSFVVLATGKTSNITLMRSSGFPLLDDAAIHAVRRARFMPATQDGAPISSKVLQPFKFQLQ